MYRVFIVLLLCFSLQTAASVRCSDLPLFSKSLELVKKIGHIFSGRKSVKVDLKDLNESLDSIIRKYQLEPHYSYEFSVGKSKKQSIYEHTLNTLKVFLKQIRNESYVELESKHQISVFKVMSYALMVHDVGKAFAYERGSSKYQHVYNIPLSSRLIDRLKNLNPKEKLLAKSIVHNSQMGSLLQSKMTNQQFREFLDYIAREADSIGIPILAYFRLARLFFISDAGSYDILVDEKQVFEKLPAGHLRIRSKRFRQFERSLGVEIDPEGLYPFSI